ncbi:Phosphoribosylglycinamide formyltransferase, partial [termite gut metagenome]
GEKVITLLRQYRIDFIVLAGFLLRIPEVLLCAYPHKIINIHPALLPKFGGKGMYGNKVHEAVVAANEKESGITVHYVNEYYDKGEIIFQTKCEILPEDFPEDVAKKVHALEYTYFPEIIDQVINNDTL